jgi:hypothetical protein
MIVSPSRAASRASENRALKSLAVMVLIIGLPSQIGLVNLSTERQGRRDPPSVLRRFAGDARPRARAGFDLELTVTTVCFQAGNSICEDPKAPPVRLSPDDRPVFHRNIASDRVGAVQFLRDCSMEGE